MIVNQTQYKETRWIVVRSLHPSLLLGFSVRNERNIPPVFVPSPTFLKVLSLRL